MPTLAQLTREQLARAMRDGFDRDATAPTLLLVFGVAFLGIMLWLAWRNRTVHQAVDATPMKLFHDLAREMKLPLLDRWLLVRIAAVQGLPNPITLLISPRTMRHHAAAYAQGRPARLRLRLLRKVAAIRRSVFKG